MDKGSFGVEEIKFVVEPGPRFNDGRRVANHADGTLHGGQISARNYGRCLVIDAHLCVNDNMTSDNNNNNNNISYVNYFESSRAPIDELDRPFALHGRNGRIDIFGHHVATVEQTDGHVFSLPWITLKHDLD